MREIDGELGRVSLELSYPQEVQGVRVRAVDLECGFELGDRLFRIPLLHGDRAEVVVGLLQLRVGTGELSLPGDSGDLPVGL